MYNVRELGFVTEIKKNGRKFDGRMQENIRQEQNSCRGVLFIEYRNRQIERDGHGDRYINLL